MSITRASVNPFHIVTACALLVGASVSATVSAQDVVWTDLVNVTASGPTLQKTGGCSGCQDAGARSQQEIASGDGFVEFTIGEANTAWFAGLSHGNASTSPAEINFSFRFNGAGAADVTENGIYRGGDTLYAVGDVFRVAVVNGRVEYRRNGTLLYTSLVAPTYPLLLDTSLLSLGATIRNAQIVGGGTVPPPPSPDVVWTDLVNVAVSGTTLQKTGGCDGCQDAGARSEQEIASGDGFVEFTIGETNTAWFAGLSHGNPGTSAAEINFSFRFNGAGAADVTENGIYRGGDTLYAVGDVFRVAVVNGRVEYRRNGTLLYTSLVAPTYPLLLDTSLLSLGATIRNAQIVGGETVTPPPSPDVMWTDLVNVTVSGTTLQKTGGCSGCQDAGARSQQEIASGDGFVEFTIGETNTAWFAGLSHGNPGTSAAEINFSFRFNGAGAADVTENGIYRGGDTLYAAGDVFRVAVVNGRVEYRRNGTLLYTSLVAPTYPLLLDTSLLSLGATIRNAQIVGGETVTPPPSQEGGFIEKSGTQAFRPRLTAPQIAAFLPAQGPFTFPAPYNTRGVRVTSAADCGGRDCVAPVGYSYWRNMNNHVGSDTMYIFLGLNKSAGGGGPTLFSYNKVTDQVQNLGPLFDPSSPFASSTAEAWYFSGTRPTTLYAYLNGTTQLRRYDVLTRQFDATPAMDLANCPRPSVCGSDAAYIIQPHSSDDDHVHSASVQNTDWRPIACVVYRDNATPAFLYYPEPAGFSLDECHVDKSGRWLLLLEYKDSNNAGDNRLVNLQTGQITTLLDTEGGLGHLDMGFGYAVGADNYNSLPEATILVEFPVASTQRPIGPVVHFNPNWQINAANHVAHGNAKPGVPASQQFACGSNASRVSYSADEIICFPLDPNRNADGSLDVLVVAPVMTNLDAPGGPNDDYSRSPKGNIDVTGTYFIWTSNMSGNGSRLDAFIVKVPAGLLMGPR